MCVQLQADQSKAASYSDGPGWEPAITDSIKHYMARMSDIHTSGVDDRYVRLKQQLQVASLVPTLDVWGYSWKYAAFVDDLCLEHNIAAREDATAAYPVFQAAGLDSTFVGNMEPVIAWLTVLCFAYVACS